VTVEGHFSTQKLPRTIISKILQYCLLNHSKIIVIGRYVEGKARSIIYSYSGSLVGNCTLSVIQITLNYLEGHFGCLTAFRMQ